jgi:hypothetical protein
MNLRGFCFGVTIVAILICPTSEYSQVTLPAGDVGRRLMRRVVKVFGGEENLSTVKSVRERLSEQYYLSQTGQLVMSVDTVRNIQFPNNVQFEVINGGVTKTLGPTGAFGVAHGKVLDLPAARSGMLDDVKRDIINIAQHVNDPKYVFEVVGKSKVGSIEAAIVNIDADGAKTQWGIDAESGKLLVTDEDFNDNLLGAGMIHQWIRCGDYKKFGSLNLPAKSIVHEQLPHEFSDALDRRFGHMGGNVGSIFYAVAELTIEKINPNIAKDAFDRPTN